MIKTILFDVDGVLIDSFEANFEFYRRLFTRTGYIPPTKTQYKDLFQATMMGVIKTITQSTDEHEIQRLMEIGKQRDGIYPYELIKTPPSLHAIIEILHKTYTLGIVTSRVTGRVFEIPQLKTLEKYFASTIYFEDTENHKPHPDPLLFALKQLNVSPDETVYVGDQQADFLAARSAGTNIIMFTKESFPDADACITDFEKLPETIAAINQTHI